MLDARARAHLTPLLGGLGLLALARLMWFALPLFDEVNVRGPRDSVQPNPQGTEELPLHMDEASLKRLVRRLLQDRDLGPVVESLLREICAEMGWDPEEVRRQL